MLAATLTALATHAEAGQGPTSARVGGLQGSFEERLQSGRSLLEQGRSVEAVGLLEEAVRLRNADAGAKRLLGRAYFETGQFNRALDAYAAVLRLEPGDLESRVRMADVFLIAGLPDEAERVMTPAAEALAESWTSDYVEINQVLGELYADAGRLGDARRTMERAVEVAGGAAEAVIYMRLGDLSKELLDFDAALAAYRNALARNPDNIECRLALADLYLQQNALDPASAEYARVLAGRPDNARAHRGLATVHWTAGRFSEAVLAARRAMDADPGHRGAHYVLGRSLVAIGLVEEGREALETYRKLSDTAEALDRRIRAVHARNTGAMVQLISGEVDAAIRMLEDAMDRYPDTGSLYFTLSLAFGQSGRHEAAVAVLHEMLDRNLDSTSAVHRRLSVEYRALGEAESSRRHEMLALEMGRPGADGRREDQ